ncbi:MAG TPA: hypothetical protein VG899_07545 [Mycobacteriales bacterium]|nr:hypothetical protein [Mycobacteriales bacterium]
MTHSLQSFAARQDGIVTRGQALEELTLGQLRHRLARRWTPVLPGVYATFTGRLSLRQRCRAALLYAGSSAQLADVTALAAHGVRFLPTQSAIHLLIPATEHRMSKGSVVVRRTHRLPEPVYLNGLPYCPTERALVEAAARIGSQQTANAIVADAVQRRLAREQALLDELAHLAGRGAGIARRAVIDVVKGARSAPEIDFLELCRRDKGLPEPLINPLLELPDGRRVSPDALFRDAPLVHETNGRAFHSGEYAFESMQARHDAMTSAGLTVLHNSPRRLRREGAAVLNEVLACYRRLEGQPLPPGVRLLRRGAA